MSKDVHFISFSSHILPPNDEPNISDETGIKNSPLLNGQNHTKVLINPEKSGICDGKKGILLIRKSDGDSAIGTKLFSYVINQLQYADQNNLVPWIHLDPAFPCYDESVHGNETTLSFTWPSGMKESKIIEMGDKKCVWQRGGGHYPGPVVTTKAKREQFDLIGNGIWQSYFKPLTEPIPIHDPSCRDKPLFSLHKKSIYPGLHICAPWAVRSWSFGRLPNAYRPQGIFHEWFSPMRKRGADIVSRYYRLQPWLESLVETANPNKEKKCLSMHIRLTDKAAGRKKPPLSAFKTYAEAYAEASMGGSIYIATDDGTILERIREEWKGAKKILTQKNVIRSSGNDAIFRVFTNETHRTNYEGLVDIYAMSRCEFFVHGFSAMAEAAIYLNPTLHLRSVNVDYNEEELMDVASFRKIVKEFYST